MLPSVGVVTFDAGLARDRFMVGTCRQVRTLVTTETQLGGFVEQQLGVVRMMVMVTEQAIVHRDRPMRRINECVSGQTDRTRVEARLLLLDLYLPGSIDCSFYHKSNFAFRDAELETIGFTHRPQGDGAQFLVLSIDEEFLIHG